MTTALAVTNFGAVAPRSTATPVLIKWTPSLNGSASYTVLNVGQAFQGLFMNAAGTDFGWVTPSNVPFQPNIMSAATATLVVGQPNIGTFAGTIVATLPTTVAVGQVIQINSQDSTLITVAQNAGQQIRGAGGTVTANGTGGSVTTTIGGASLLIQCVIANTDFSVTSTSDSLIFQTT